MERNKQKPGEERTYEQLPSDELVRLLAERDQTIADLKSLLAKSDPSATPMPILHGDLPETQRAVLQAILDLPEDAFADAARLMEPLIGMPVSHEFVTSMKAVLAAKDWGVECPKCNKPSSVGWLKEARFAKGEGGRAYFSHSGNGPHGKMTKIPRFLFSKKIDQRLSQK